MTKPDLKTFTVTLRDAHCGDPTCVPCNGRLFQEALSQLPGTDDMTQGDTAASIFTAGLMLLTYAQVPMLDIALLSQIGTQEGRNLLETQRMMESAERNMTRAARPGKHGAN